MGFIAVVFIICAYFFPEFRVATRDIAIILGSLFLIIATIVATALLFAILYTVNVIRNTTVNTILPRVTTLQEKVDQILDNATSVAGNVKDSTSTLGTTTTYVAEQVVSPVIRLSGLVAGVRAGAAFLARRGAPRE
jgi:hypothetical protein